MKRRPSRPASCPSGSSRRSSGAPERMLALVTAGTASQVLHSAVWTRRGCLRGCMSSDAGVSEGDMCPAVWGLIVPRSLQALSGTRLQQTAARTASALACVCVGEGRVVGPENVGKCFGGFPFRGVRDDHAQIRIIWKRSSLRRGGRLVAYITLPPRPLSPLQNRRSFQTVLEPVLSLITMAPVNVKKICCSMCLDFSYNPRRRALIIIVVSIDSWCWLRR